MRVHLVHAHSEPRSYFAAKRDVIVEELTLRGAGVTFSDLYATGFGPVPSAADFRARQRPGHLVYALEQRHAYGAGSLGPDIGRLSNQLIFPMPDLDAFGDVVAPRFTETNS